MAPTSVEWLPFAAGLALIFVKLANLPELAYAATGVNLKIPYLVAPLAYIGAAFSSRLGESLRNRSVILLLLFFGWLVLAVPFSSWPGGSFGVAKNYILHMLPLVFVASSTIFTWKQLRIVFNVCALCGLVVLGNALIFGVEDSGRISLASSSTIGNANDLAAHMLLLLPFLLWVSMDKARNFFFRLVSVGAIGYTLLVILRTGSRGALVSLLGGAVFVLLRASMNVRLTFLVSAVALVLIIPPFLPDATKARLGSLFGEAHEEADLSGNSRSYLFWKSVEFTFKRPVFGVGPGQFATYEGTQSRAEGQHGNWHATHCSWTEISSECGIPAILFMLGALATSLVPLYRTLTRAKAMRNREIEHALFCTLLGIAMFLVAVTFLAHGYSMYFPLIVGLSIAASRIALAELAVRTTRQVGIPVPRSA